jgi:hypothetical protein
MEPFSVIAGGIVFEMVKAGAISFASTGRSILAKFVFARLDKSGEAKPLTQLRDHPSPRACIGVQNALAVPMRSDPAFGQKLDAQLKVESPAQWSWAHQVISSPARLTPSFTWDGYFATAFSQWNKVRADELRRKYGISDQQYLYELTRACPFCKYSGVRLHRKLAPSEPRRFQYPTGVELSQDLKSISMPISTPYWKLDLNSYTTSIPKGAWLVCSRDKNHSWWVYAH